MRTPIKFAHILATLAAAVGFDAAAERWRGRGDSGLADKPMRDGNTKKRHRQVTRDRRNRHLTGHGVYHRRRYLRMDPAAMPRGDGEDMLNSLRNGNRSVPGSMRGTEWIRENRQRRAAGLPQNRAFTPEMLSALAAIGILTAVG